MKQIACLGDLEQFGIKMLTGEADALSYRVLCDLTEEGRALVAETFGIRTNGFPENWNSDSVASCLLAHDAYTAIAPIALIKSCNQVWETDKDGNRVFYGTEEGETFNNAEYDWDDKESKSVLKKRATITRDGETMNWPHYYGKIGRTYYLPNCPRRGTSNIHAMSGRSA